MQLLGFGAILPSLGPVLADRWPPRELVDIEILTPNAVR